VGVAGRHAHAEERHARLEAAIEPLLVQHERRQPRPPGPLPAEVPEDGIGVGHLRHDGRVHERAGLHDVHARGDERLDPGDLALGRHEHLLDLETVAHADFVDEESGHHINASHSHAATGSTTGLAMRIEDPKNRRGNIGPLLLRCFDSHGDNPR
jgi:hypothetical protein